MSEEAQIIPGLVLELSALSNVLPSHMLRSLPRVLLRGQR
jgi:hypothetical protein